jgi:hypothetical protein
MSPLEGRFPEPPADLPVPAGIIVLGGAINGPVSKAPRPGWRRRRSNAPSKPRDSFEKRGLRNTKTRLEGRAGVPGKRGRSLRMANRDKATFADQFLESAADACTEPPLAELARKLWRAHAEGPLIADADAEAISEAVPTRWAPWQAHFIQPQPRPRLQVFTSARPEHYFPCSVVKNSLFPKLNSLFRWRVNLRIRPLIF